MDKFLSQVVVRHLPPTMTQKQFLEQISPAPEHNYFHYSKADLSLGQYSFCRACINFVNQEDIFVFKDKFDGYVFVDQKGNEYPAIVEFSPFQKIPRRRFGSNGQPLTAKKRDSKSGTIEDDSDYKNFLEFLKESKSEVSLPSAEIYLEEIEARDRELKANHGVTKVTTPLIEFIKQRKAEKNRLRDERREERKRQQEKKMMDEEHYKREKERNGPYKLKKRDKKEKSRERREKNQNERSKDKQTKEETEKSSKDSKKQFGKNKSEKETKKSNDAPTFTVRVLQNSSKEKPRESSKSSQDSCVKVNSEKLEASHSHEKSVKEVVSKDAKPSQDQETKEHDKKLEIKRVRNKDRPAMEIYRPGMRRALNQGASQSSLKSKEHEVNKKSHSNSRNNKVYTRSRNNE